MPSASAAAEDIDMSASTTLPADGQNHDREDRAPMADSEVPEAEHLNEALPPVAQPSEEAAALNNADTSGEDTQNATGGADAMDTTPDDAVAPPDVVAQPNVATTPPPQTASQVPHTDREEEQDTSNETRDEAPPTSHAAEGETDTAASTIENATSEQIMPPPPPPQDEPQRVPPQSSNGATPEGTPPPDSSSDDEDNGSWREIEEDTSMPDEEELKEIEEVGEHSADDHEYWEKKTFTSLDEPEFVPGPSGRIEWLVEHYNGTKQQPNRDLVMKSHQVEIGGHTWQIKFYPKGNDSDYLSIYIECTSVADQSKAAAEQGSDKSKQKEDHEMTDADVSAEPIVQDIQHAPLPLLTPEPIPKRRSVAAQVSLVLYNPDEPRVNCYRSCLHRFCAGSPDWGWTRFYGPYYEIQHRRRGQRQALLRNDKLAFRTYIRVVEDATNCLWEHDSLSNPWDCFAMTGLQGMLPDDSQTGHGGNIISALSTWLNLQPFRKILYDVKVPDPIREPRKRPKPLVASLQKLLYSLRTQVQPGAGCVITDDVIEALDWYGIDANLGKLDVVELWDLLRTKFEQELEETSSANRLTELFGPPRSRSLGPPKYRAPVKGVKSVQAAVDRAKNSFPTGSRAPRVLHVELDRQDFDEKARCWRKLTDKIKIDEQVTLAGKVSYKLFGFIAHNENLQSGRYSSVLRPDGPDGKWFQYRDGKEDKKVKCLTRKQALYRHQGSSDSTGSVAYIIVYLRNDVAETAFSNECEPIWDVPEWIVDEVKRHRVVNGSVSHHSDDRASPDGPDADEVAGSVNDEHHSQSKGNKDDLPTRKVEFQVFDSQAFNLHDGPGLIDNYSNMWLENSHVRSVEVNDTSSVKDLRASVATAFEHEFVSDPRQVRLWVMDSLDGYLIRPRLVSVDCIDGPDFRRFETAADIEELFTERRLWAHFMPLEDLPPLPEATPPPPETTSSPPLEATSLPPPENSSLPPPEITSPPPPETTSLPPPETTSPPPVPPPGELPEEIIPEHTENSVSTNGEVPTAPNPIPSEVQISANEDTIMSDPEDDDRDDEPPQPPSSTIQVDVVSADGANDDSPAAEVTVPPPPPPPGPAEDTEMGDVAGEPVPVALIPPPPPPPVDIDLSPPQPPGNANGVVVVPPPPPPAVEDIYLFIKRFDIASQKLSPVCSAVFKKSAAVLPSLRERLSLPTDAPLSLYQELNILTAAPLRISSSSVTFAHADLSSTDVVIARFPAQPPDGALPEFAKLGLHADPHEFLRARATARNQPHLAQRAHIVRDFFSAERFAGEVAPGGAPHGAAGVMTYHSGDAYSGGFALGRRHGRGFMQYANGDTYQGDWVADGRHGRGTFVESATGNTYTGGWKHDRRHGEGVTHWKVAQETERLCRICWEEDAGCAFYDCGHVVACLACARRVDSCPVCRRRVLSAMKLYYVS